MWIVRLALSRPYTFVVVALLIAVLGAVSIYRMSTDIFPEIDIPVVSVVWQYAGMPADELETRIVLVNERMLTASVNDIEHIESQSLYGVGGDPHLLPRRRQCFRSGSPGHGHLPDASQESCRRASRRRTSFATAPPACRSCRSPSPATR